MSSKKIIFFNKKLLPKESSILRFGKNQDNYLIKNIDKIELLTKSILKSLSKNKRSNDIFVLDLNKKRLKFLHQRNVIKKINNKCLNIKSKPFRNKKK